MRLSDRDIRRFNEAVLSIHRTRGPEDFSGKLLQALGGILAVDICTTVWQGPDGRGTRIDFVSNMARLSPPGLRERVRDYSHQNPVYENYPGGPVAISDLMSRERWHRTGLHAEIYRPMEQEDGLFLILHPAAGCRLSMVATRARRGFSREERCRLGLLEPHVREVFHRLRLEGWIQHCLSAKSGAEAVTGLSPREREVLHWLAQGKSNAEIAILLEIRPGTVKRHLENLYAKLGVENRHAAALIALRLGRDEALEVADPEEDQAV